MLSRLLNNITHADLEMLCSAFSWLAFIETKGWDLATFHKPVFVNGFSYKFYNVLQQNMGRSLWPAFIYLLVAVDFNRASVTSTVTSSETSRKDFSWFSHSFLSRYCFGNGAHCMASEVFRFQREPQTTSSLCVRIIHSTFNWTKQKDWNDALVTPSTPNPIAILGCNV